MTRIAAVIVALAIAGTGCGDTKRAQQPGASTTAATGPTVTYRSKTADAVVQVATQVAAARARGAKAGELVALSTSLVHVRADGDVEVVLHTGSPVTAGQLDDLRRLSAEVVDTSATPAVPGQPPAGVVQAWVPAERLAELANLAWVAAVTPPAYPMPDAGG